MRGRNHAQGLLDSVIDALKILARRAEYSLTESALSPFQAEPTQKDVLAGISRRFRPAGIGNWMPRGNIGRIAAGRRRD